MRNFSGLYFWLCVLSTSYLVTYRFLPQWTYEAILFMSTAMLIAFVRPYKKNIYECFGFTSIISSRCELSPFIDIIKILYHSTH